MDLFLPPDRPAWCDGLLAEVRGAFEQTGAGTPEWPDPHAGADPAEEEYSRCLDPTRYRILDARVEAWVSVLTARGVADARDVPPTEQEWIGASRPPTALLRVRRVEARRPGGLVLLMATTLVDGAPFGLDVGLAAPDRSVAQVDLVPYCGCDACDRGSAGLLEAVDGWFLDVAHGGLVHARKGEHCVTRTVDGWRSTGDAAHTWLDEARPAPPGVERWRGEPWL